MEIRGRLGGYDVLHSIISRFLRDIEKCLCRLAVFKYPLCIMHTQTALRVLFHIVHLKLELVRISPVIITFTAGNILRIDRRQDIFVLNVYPLLILVFLLKNHFKKVRILLFIFSYDIRCTVC